MAVRLRAVGLAAATAALTCAVASCSDNTSPSHGAPAQRAVPVPNAPPCRVPTPRDIASLAQSSAFVLEATISGNTVDTARTLGTGQNALELEETPITGVKVLSRTSATTAVPTSITGEGFSWGHLLKPGRYVLFLLSNGEPTMGMYGIIDISGATVARRCPNYSVPGTWLEGTGAPLTVASFEAELPRSLPPTSGPAPDAAPASS